MWRPKLELADMAVLSSCQTHGRDKSILKRLWMLATFVLRVSWTDKGRAGWPTYSVLLGKFSLDWILQRGKKKKKVVFWLHKVEIWAWMPWLSTGNIHDYETDCSYSSKTGLLTVQMGIVLLAVMQPQIIYSLLMFYLWWSIADPYRFELKGNHAVRKSEIKTDVIYPTRSKLWLPFQILPLQSYMCQKQVPLCSPGPR